MFLFYLLISIIFALTLIYNKSAQTAILDFFNKINGNDPKGILILMGIGNTNLLFNYFIFIEFY